MMSATPEDQSACRLRILHPTDFSKTSEVAFAHALKLALRATAELEILHISPYLAADESDVHWTDFPGVRATLSRWGILPPGASREEVAEAGLRVKKVVQLGSDPLACVLEYCRDDPPDLLVLATHQREGVARWMHKAIAEPLSRRSGAMTLFVPHDDEGFIALENGAVKLQRILIPVDREPSAQAALEEAFFLAEGLECATVEFKLIHVGTARTMPTLYLPHRPDWNWTEQLLHGDVVEEILRAEADWHPDLMVLTTQGHVDFFDALRGSTTERVLRGARCPVLAVPAGVPRDDRARHT